MGGRYLILDAPGEAEAEIPQPGRYRILEVPEPEPPRPAEFAGRGGGFLRPEGLVEGAARRLAPAASAALARMLTPPGRPVPEIGPPETGPRVFGPLPLTRPTRFRPAEPDPAKRAAFEAAGPGPVEQAVSSTARAIPGVLSSIASTPENLERGIRAASERLVGVPSMKAALGLDDRTPVEKALAAGPFAAATAAAPPEDVRVGEKPLFAGRVTVPETQGERAPVVQAANTAADRLQAVSEAIAKDTRAGRLAAEMAARPWKDRLTDTRYWAELLGQGVGSMAPTLAAGALLGPEASLPLLYGMEAGEAAKDTREQEARTGRRVDDAEAFSRQALRGVVNAALERIVPESILRGPAAATLRKRALDSTYNALKEGVTESAQELVGNLLSTDPEKRSDALRGVVEAGLAGLLAGAATSAPKIAAPRAVEPSPVRQEEGESAPPAGPGASTAATRDPAVTAQLEALRAGTRGVVFFPTAAADPAAKAADFGAEAVKTSAGTFFFDARKTSAEEIRKAVKKQKVADLIGRLAAPSPTSAEETKPVSPPVAEPTPTPEPEAARERRLEDAEPAAPAPPAVSAPEPATPERRVDAERRKRVSEMTEEELRRELFTDPLTGAESRRAWEEDDAARAAPVKVIADLNGLKYLNESYGHSFADEFLRAYGRELKAAGLRPFRYGTGSDEMVMPLQDERDVAKLEVAREALKKQVFVYSEPQGRQVEVSGVDFSYGHGQDLTTADTRNADRKRAAYAAVYGAGTPTRGLRPPGLSERVRAAGDQAGRDVAPEGTGAGARPAEEVAPAPSAASPPPSAAPAEAPKPAAPSPGSESLPAGLSVVETDGGWVVQHEASGRRIGPEADSREAAFAQGARAAALGLDWTRPLEAIRKSRAESEKYNAWYRAEKDRGEDVAPAPVPAAAAPSSAPKHVLGSEARGETVKTERGREVPTRFALAEARDLIASHDERFEPNPRYPAELQPRDRGRSAAVEQVRRMARDLDPRRLGRSVMASEGAPIVGDDNVVESGNGRTLAIRAAYADPGAGDAGSSAGRYRQHLRSTAGDLGLDPAEVDRMKEPVLVRVRTGDVSDRAAFTREANEAPVAQMSATEQARVDAEALTPEVMALFAPGEDGRLDVASNREFVRAFFSKVDPARRARFQNADGSLSRDGLDAVRNAVFYRAFDDLTALERLAEALDDETKGVTAALVEAAPAFAALRESQRRGERWPVDVAHPIVRAATKLGQLRSQGQSVRDFVEQTSLFGAELEPVEMGVLDVLDRLGRSPRRLGAWLRYVAKTVDAAGAPAQGDLFGGRREGPTAAEVMDAASKEWAAAFGEADVVDLQPPGDPSGSGVEAAREPEEGARPAAPVAEAVPGGGPEPAAVPPRRLTPRSEGAPIDLGEGERGPAPAAAPRRASKNVLVRLAEAIRERLATGEAITSRELGDLVKKTTGEGMAKGHVLASEALEAANLALNLDILEKPDEVRLGTGPDTARRTAEDLAAREALLPTPSRRSAEQDSHQQFSTPHDYAFAVARLAGVTAEDVVLEPSAGEGNLAVFAQAAGAEVVANEISQRRRGLLEALGLDRVTKENAETLDSTLPADLRPTVVLMNPPFSATAGRMGSKRVLGTAAKHIDEALKRLEPGGRLVAIVGRGMTLDAPTYAAFFKRVQRLYALRANVGVGGRVFRKQGTEFATRVLVIDKPAEGEAARGGPALVTDVDTVAQLMETTEEVRRDRRPVERTIQRHDAARIPEGLREADRGLAEGGEGRLRLVGPADAGAPRVVPGERGRATEPGRADAVVRSSGEPDGARLEEPGEGGRLRPSDGGRRSGAQPGEPGGESGSGEPRDRALGGGDREAEGGRERRDASGDGSGADRRRVERREPAAAAEGAPTPSEPESEEDDGPVAIFDRYVVPSLPGPRARPHASTLVESAPMAAIAGPEITYVPDLPEGVVERGDLSAAQVEAVARAGQAFEQELPNGRRRGFFVGDGTGVGKGREIAATILDQMRRGRKKAVWVSEAWHLLDAAERDWTDVSGPEGSLFALRKTKYGKAIDRRDGVAFVTYDMLRYGIDEKGMVKRGNRSRVDQLVEWLGPDFDGTIVFDEAHNLANFMPDAPKKGEEDERGGLGRLAKPSLQAVAAAELDKRLPRARILYVSATGASEVRNLAYAGRLGLWGEGTAFPTASAFVTQVERGGIAGMEQVAQDLKALGLYVSRSLSLKGVETRRLRHALTESQRRAYDKMAEAWGVVLRNMERALELTAANSKGKVAPTARAAVRNAFWSSSQRFWNQVLTAMQMPSLLKSIEADMKAGRASVVQLVSTLEAAQNRAVAEAENPEDLDSLNLTPLQVLTQLVDKAFPTQQLEEYVDDNGHTKTQPALDSSGNPIQNREAVRMKEKLLLELGSLTSYVPDGPLDQLLRHFGADKVAEVTGRSQRIVWTDGKAKLEKRGSRANASEIDAFQNGPKRILVFSEAGGTGASYHASVKAGNRAQRIHYLLQPGWRANAAMQGLGRTNRAGQVVAPVFVLTETDVPGHARFISTIARRLDQLGALSRGERKAAGAGLFAETDNLESPLARAALLGLYNSITRGSGPISLDAFQHGTGLRLVSSDGKVKTELPGVEQFLNRLLALPLDDQGRVFEDFMRRFEGAIEKAREDGTLDRGVERFEADRIERISEEAIHRDERSGAVTKHVKLRVLTKVKPVPWSRASANRSSVFVQNLRSGRVYAAEPSGALTAADGEVKPRVRLVSQTDTLGDHLFREDLDDATKWRRLDDGEARRAWGDALKKLPEWKTREVDVVSGALLPIWDRLGDSDTKIWRFQLADGTKLLGRVLPSAKAGNVLRRLGLEASRPTLSAEEAIEQVLDDSAKLELANGWSVKRSFVNGEWRLELTGPDFSHFDELRRAGAFTERTGARTRVFLPSGETKAARVEAAKSLGQIIERRPILEVVESGGGRTDYSMPADAPRPRPRGERRAEARGERTGEYDEETSRPDRPDVEAEAARAKDELGDEPPREERALVRRAEEPSAARRGAASEAPDGGDEEVEEKEDRLAPLKGGLRQTVNVVRSVLSADQYDQAAKLSADSYRKHLAARDLRMQQIERTLEEHEIKAERWKPDEALGFLFAIEDGRSQPDPEKQPAANLIRAIFDQERDLLAALDNVSLKSWILNYYPHLWKDEDKASEFVDDWTGKNPFPPSGFLKKRKLPTIKDGIEAGLKLKWDNPISAAIARSWGSSEYLLRHWWLNEMRSVGLVRPVAVDDFAIPPGWQKLPEGIGNIISKPSARVSEYLDAGLLEQLEAFLKGLGVEHKRIPGWRGEAGSTSPAKAGETPTVTTKFGSTMGVLVHEIGHQLDYQFGLWKFLTDRPGRPQLLKEMQALAELRTEGLPKDERTALRQMYGTPAELTANLVDAFVNHRARAEEMAPAAVAAMKEFILANPKVDALMWIHPTMRVGTKTIDVEARKAITGYYIAPTSVVRLMERTLSPSLGRFAAYRGIRAAANTMVSFALGASGFHWQFTALATAGDMVALGVAYLGAAAQRRGSIEGERLMKAGVSKIARGLNPLTPFRLYAKGRDVQRRALGVGLDDPTKLFSQGPLDEQIQAVIKGGGGFAQSREFETHFRKQWKKAVEDENWAKAGLVALPAFIELLAAPTMQHWVPALKLGVFLELAQFETARLGEKASEVERVHALQRAWHSVDNRLGQMRYDNRFWRKSVRQMGHLFFQSLGWQLGDVTEFGGGLVDLATMKKRLGKAPNAEAEGVMGADLRDPVVTHRMTYWVGMFTIVSIVGAIYQYLKTGEPPEEPQDLLFPKTGGVNRDGTPERATLPTYAKDVWAWSHAPVATLSHKVNPFVSTVSEIVKNETFFGDQIIDPDSSAGKKAADYLEYLVGRFVPYSLRSVGQSRLAGSRIRPWEPLVGVNKASASLSRSEAMSRIVEWERAHRPSAARPPDQAERDRRARDLGWELRLARQAGDKDAEAEARRKLEEAVAGDEISRSQAARAARQNRKDPTIRRFAALPLAEAIRVFEVATEAEKRLWAPALRKKRRTGTAGMSQEDRARFQARVDRLVPPDSGSLMEALRGAGM